MAFYFRHGQQPIIIEKKYPKRACVDRDRRELGLGNGQIRLTGCGEMERGVRESVGVSVGNEKDGRRLGRSVIDNILSLLVLVDLLLTPVCTRLQPQRSPLSCDRANQLNSIAP
ncbi:hypothetical protein RRG08_019372 [Elysia crispata]|uniref:Uncharacterized protein n=1 Tax=Elysia crispata TaxID=231223 RepID=A0AAE1AUS7_9GAST|nr:hypothetical protein RRG08_019372 [Elysia crispata]